MGLGGALVVVLHAKAKWRLFIKLDDLAMLLVCLVLLDLLLDGAVLGHLFLLDHVRVVGGGVGAIDIAPLGPLTGEHVRLERLTDLVQVVTSCQLVCQIDVVTRARGGTDRSNMIVLAGLLPVAIYLGGKTLDIWLLMHVASLVHSTPCELLLIDLTVAVHLQLHLGV